MSPMSLKQEMEARQVYKAWAIEENLDRYFFRPVAMLLTELFHRLRMTPNQVSILGMLVGVACAPFLPGVSPASKGAAISLLWIAEILDAADGQLARRTASPSRYGRVLDGFCGAVVAMTVYATIGVTLYRRTGHWIFLALAPLSLMANGLHSVLYDFYRMEYMRIVDKRRPRNPETPEALARAREAARRSAGLIQRALLLMHHQFAQRQVWATPTYQPLVAAVDRQFRRGEISTRFAQCYRDRQRPMVRWWNYLGPNSHLLLITACVLVGRIEWVLWGNVIVFNLYAVLLTRLQKPVTRALLEDLRHEAAERVPAPADDRTLALVP